jgi:hypothetical protein
MDTSRYKANECTVEEETKQTSALTSVTDITKAPEPEESEESEESEDEGKNANLVVEELNANVQKDENKLLTETQKVIGNVVETAVGSAKDEINALIPEIEGEIEKQEKKLNTEITIAEKSLAQNVTLNNADKKMLLIHDDIGKVNEQQFSLNETYKLKLLDVAYSNCEKYTNKKSVATLFHRVEMATDDKVKHDLLIRLNEVCKELEHPTPIEIIHRVTTKNETNDTLAEKVVTPSPTPSPTPTPKPVIKQTMEEKVEAIEHELEKRSDILSPYNSRDNDWIQNILNSVPKGDGGHRIKYTQEQYRWIHHAKAGSSAVRQFAQMQPRYTQEIAKKIVLDSENHHRSNVINENATIPVENITFSPQ